MITRVCIIRNENDRKRSAAIAPLNKAFIKAFEHERELTYRLNTRKAGLRGSTRAL